MMNFELSYMEIPNQLVQPHILVFSRLITKIQTIPRGHIFIQRRIYVVNATLYKRHVPAGDNVMCTLV